MTKELLIQTIEMTKMSTPIQILILPLLLLLLPILYLIMKGTKSYKHQKPLPPGPIPLPIIGNLLNLAGSSPHVALANVARSYGPLISLKLGSQLYVVGSTPEAAMEILKTNDRVLSGRKVPHVAFARDPRWNHLSIIWTFECTEQWKLLRRLCKEELFSSKMIENQSCLRENKVRELVQFLKSKQGLSIKLVDAIDISSFNFLGTIFFSDDKFTSFDEIEKGGHGMSSFIREGVELCGTPNISDFYPILGSLDIQGLKRKADVFVKQMCNSWARILVQRRQMKTVIDVSSKKRDFLDVLLHNGFTDDQINSLFVELFAAGSHTATSTLEWAMAEIIKNSQVLYKIHAELDREVSGNFVKESDLAQLRYLRAVVKETLRLHPLGPLLLPHCAIETCQVMNYTIPKDTQVLVNVWAISRDPKVWENPSSFIPERFLDSELDFKGNDFKFLPFGAGRRICPGLPMAIRQVELMLANFFHCFEWSLADGILPHQLNMNEKFGVVLEMEKPLMVIPKYKW